MRTTKLLAACLCGVALVQGCNPRAVVRNPHTIAKTSAEEAVEGRATLGRAIGVPGIRVAGASAKGRGEPGRAGLGRAGAKRPLKQFGRIHCSGDHT